MLENPLVYLTILSPLVAVALWYIKLNGKKWLILSSLGIFAVTVYWAFNPPTITNITYHMPYYTLFLLVYILLLLPKFGAKQTNKILASAIFMLFIAGEVWELPVFFYDFVLKKGFVADWGWWFSHIRRVYTFAVFVLFARLSGIKVMRKEFWADTVFLLGVFMVMLYPSFIVVYGFLPTAARLVSLSAFGVIVFEAL